MELEVWKQNSANKFRELGYWLNQYRQKELPYVVYGTMAGLTLWPLVQSAVTSGDGAQMVNAVYTLLSGIGAGLVANQIEAWKNRTPPITEGEVIEVVAKEVSNDNFRKAVDAIFEKLGTIPQAQASLSGTDKEWFEAQLQKELSQLGNSNLFPGAKSVGERGVLLENSTVEGSIITGNLTVGGDFTGRDKK